MDVKYESLEYCKDGLGESKEGWGGRVWWRDKEKKGMEEKGRGRMREQIIKD